MHVLSRRDDAQTLNAQTLWRSLELGADHQDLFQLAIGDSQGWAFSDTIIKT